MWIFEGWRMISCYFTDIEQCLRIRIHHCYDCGHIVEFRTHMKVYYCPDCKKYIAMKEKMKLSDINEISECVLDTDKKTLDILKWKN